MNGAAHYRAAEQALSNASHWSSDQPDAIPTASAGIWLAIASAHATLALAAATAAPLVDERLGNSSCTTDWARVIGWDAEDGVSQ